MLRQPKTLLFSPGATPAGGQGSPREIRKVLMSSRRDLPTCWYDFDKQEDSYRQNRKYHLFVSRRCGSVINQINKFFKKKGYDNYLNAPKGQ